MEQEVEINKLINEEKYLIRDIRIRTWAYLILQVLGLSSTIYLAVDPLDFVFDETRWLAIFIGVLAYFVFFLVLTLRIAFKKEIQIKTVKTQLTFILILDIIPGFILMLLALNDIF